ncbi:MAG: anti-sigma factor family protein [Gemmatimonadales bacterium]
MGHSSTGDAMHLSPDLLSGFLDDDLTADERSGVETHLASCAECRAELADVRRLLAPRRRDWLPVLVPAAAAAAVLLVLVWPRDPGAPSETRAGPTEEAPLAVVSPAPGAEVAPGSVAFTWRSAGEGASYSLTLQESDGRVAWTSLVADTVAVLPDSLALAPGHTWFWFVDAMLPDGRSLSTGVRRFATRS